MDWLECTVVRVPGWLACFLPSHVHLARPPIFAPLTQTRPLVACVPHFCARPICSPFSLPSVSFSCVLLSHRSSISVVGSLCLLCIWVVGFRYRRRRRRRRRRRGRVKKKKKKKKKGGKFFFCWIHSEGCFSCGKNSSGFMSDHDIQIPGAFGASFFFFLLKPSFVWPSFLGCVFLLLFLCGMGFFLSVCGVQERALGVVCFVFPVRSSELPMLLCGKFCHVVTHQS